MTSVDDSDRDSSPQEMNKCAEIDPYVCTNEYQTSNKIENYHKKDISNNYKSLKERKNNRNYSKSFKCDMCEKKYTWYSGLSNHKRYVHNKIIET